MSACYISVWRPEVSHISFSIFCPPSAWQAALFIGLGIFSFWPALVGDNCCEICHSFRPLTSSAYAVCKRKVSWLFSRGQPLFGEISIFYFLFAPFCLIYFLSSTCFGLMWEGRKKMLMIFVAIGFSKRLETHDTTCFILKDVSYSIFSDARWKHFNHSLNNRIDTCLIKGIICKWFEME